MKKFILIVILLSSMTVLYAQNGYSMILKDDECGCKLFGNNGILIPLFEDMEVDITFYYPNGKDYWSIDYYERDSLIKDFKLQDNMVAVNFDWEKLSALSQWKQYIHKIDGKIYLGNFDLNRNIVLNNIKLVDIHTSCMVSKCDPTKQILFVRVAFTDK